MQQGVCILNSTIHVCLIRKCLYFLQRWTSDLNASWTALSPRHWDQDRNRSWEWRLEHACIVFAAGATHCSLRPHTALAAQPSSHSIIDYLWIFMATLARPTGRWSIAVGVVCVRHLASMSVCQSSGWSSLAALRRNKIGGFSQVNPAGFQRRPLRVSVCYKPRPTEPRKSASDFDAVDFE